MIFGICKLLIYERRFRKREEKLGGNITVTTSKTNKVSVRPYIRVHHTLINDPTKGRPCLVTKGKTLVNKRKLKKRLDNMGKCQWQLWDSFYYSCLCLIWNGILIPCYNTTFMFPNELHKQLHQHRNKTAINYTVICIFVNAPPLFWPLIIPDLL